MEEMEQLDDGIYVRNMADRHNSENPFEKGSNPSYFTARSKLQLRRRRINEDIIKELRLRRGAENLLRATTNREIKEKVLIELGFVKSKLDMLRGDLAELNSSVKIYQNQNSSQHIPMITLGLKETKYTDFQTVFMDYIEEHYSEDGRLYLEQIDRLHALRKAIRTPERSEAGIQLLMSYYNQLAFVQKRFYPPGRSVPVYFTWYDSLTGVHVTQKTLGYEKGCVLFNIGALYSQLGTAQDRSSTAGLDQAINNYQRSAGILKYLRDRFTRAPSIDMNTDTLTLLMQLMLSQAQECVYERMVLDQGPPATFKEHIICCEEAAMVSSLYGTIHNTVSTSAVRNDLPGSWLTMTIMKCNHYLATAHYYLASALQLTKDLMPPFREVRRTLERVTKANVSGGNTLVYTEEFATQKQYIRLHLSYSISLNEAVEKDYSFCRMLRTNDDVFRKVVHTALENAHRLLAEVSGETDFEDIFVSAPPIVPNTMRPVQIMIEDFALVKVPDFFADLGPISVFSSQHEWTSPRKLQLTKDDKNGFGFTIKGELPSIVVEIQTGSSAEGEGLKSGDIIIGVNGINVKCAGLRKLKSMILSSGELLALTVVKKMDSTLLPSLQIADSGSARATKQIECSTDMRQLSDTMTGT